MGIEGTVIQDVEKQQLIWYGHVNRMNRIILSRMTMEWQPQEKKEQRKTQANMGIGC